MWGLRLLKCGQEKWSNCLSLTGLRTWFRVSVLWYLTFYFCSTLRVLLYIYAYLIWPFQSVIRGNMPSQYNSVQRDTNGVSTSWSNSFRPNTSPLSLHKSSSEIFSKPDRTYVNYGGHRSVSSTPHVRYRDSSYKSTLQSNSTYRDPIVSKTLYDLQDHTSRNGSYSLDYKGPPALTKDYKNYRDVVGYGRLVRDTYPENDSISRIVGSRSNNTTTLDYIPKESYRPATKPLSVPSRYGSSLYSHPTSNLTSTYSGINHIDLNGKNSSSPLRIVGTHVGSTVSLPLHSQRLIEDRPRRNGHQCLVETILEQTNGTNVTNGTHGTNVTHGTTGMNGTTKKELSDYDPSSASSDKVSTCWVLHVN